MARRDCDETRTRRWKNFKCCSSRGFTIQDLQMLLDAARRWRSVTRRQLVNERPSNAARRWGRSMVTKRELEDLQMLLDAVRRWRSSRVMKRKLVDERPSNAARRWRSSTVTKRELVDARPSIHRKKKDGGCTFYHNTLQTKIGPLGI